MAKKGGKRGKPSLYKPEYCQMLIEHMKQGYSYETFAVDIGVHRDTLYEWEKVHPEYSDTKKRAVLASQKQWEEWGIKGLWNTSGQGTHENLNTTLWIFNMKSRFKWRDDGKDAPGDPPPDMQEFEFGDLDQMDDKTLNEVYRQQIKGKVKLK